MTKGLSSLEDQKADLQLLKRSLDDGAWKYQQLLVRIPITPGAEQRPDPPNAFLPDEAANCVRQAQALVGMALDKDLQYSYIDSELAAHHTYNAAQVVADTLKARVGNEISNLQQVELAVSWVEIFRKHQCVDGVYGMYAKAVSNAITGLIECRKADAHLTQTYIDIMDDAINGESPNSSFAHALEAKPVHLKATPSTLEGLWLVTCTDPYGAQDLKEIHLYKRFGKYRFTNMSMGPSAWKAEGTWKCVDDTRVRFEGRGSAYPGGPPMVAFVDLLTIGMTDADTFSSTSPLGVSMEWSRKQ